VVKSGCKKMAKKNGFKMWVQRVGAKVKAMGEW
jgi:hypothetical protein